MLYLLNAPICHVPGLRYVTSIINRERARELVSLAAQFGELVSAIGHDGAAEVLTLVLDREVLVNRISVKYEPGDQALALQLRQRQPEGVVLTAEMVEEIGYDLTLIETSPAPVCVVYGSAVNAAVRVSEDRVIGVPSDIDVTFGGMDRHEATSLVTTWARKAGLVRTFGPLGVDCHPEICEPHRASDVHSSDGTEHVPAHYKILIPYPRDDYKPSYVVLAGVPTVDFSQVDNLASLMRRLSLHTPALEAGKAIAGWVANNPRGLHVVMTAGVRSADTTYQESTLEGLRSGWRRMTQRIHDARSLEIAGHIDGYVAGLGTLLRQLVEHVPAHVIAEVADRSNQGHHERRPFGTLKVRRRTDSPHIYEVGCGDLWMSLEEAATWMRTDHLPERHRAA